MRTRPFHVWASAPAAVVLLCAAGCGTTASPSWQSGSPSVQQPAAPVPTASTVVAVPPGAIKVFASDLLAESFREIGGAFQEAHPGTKVTFTFGDSAKLAKKITSGARADVYASVNPAAMKAVTDAGAAGESIVFARDQLIIVVIKPNPKRVFGLKDLTKPGLKVALCAPKVDCGVAAKKVLAEAGVTLTPVSVGPSGKAVAAKVISGKADAALVHRSDGRAAQDDLQPIEFYESPSAVDDYPIAALKNALNPAGAQAFIDYLRSEPAAGPLYGSGLQQVT